MTFPSSRRVHLVGLLLGLLAPVVGRAAPLSNTPTAWDFVVTLVDPARGLVDVDWTLYGLNGPVMLCTDMEGAERGVIDMRQLSAPAQQHLPAQDDCWNATAQQGQPLVLRYRFDLAILAADSGDPDYATRVGEAYLFKDNTVLLRPAELVFAAPITVEFRVPPEVRVAAPWPRLPGPGHRYRLDAARYHAGSYVGLGRLTALATLRLGHATADIVLVDRPIRSDHQTLRNWIERSLRPVVDFYGEIPGGSLQVFLAPVMSDDAGVFGTALHRGPPSVVLFFGARAEPGAFEGDWLAPHELFHIGSPAASTDIPWFIEGTATYYQEVLRARGGLAASGDMWGDFHDGMRRYCQPERGVSLGEESRRLRKSHHYTRVYWGGACLAFRVDVAIRRKSGGHASLDTVFKQLLARSRREPLTEDEIIATLDRAAGQPLVRTHLDNTRTIPLQPLYQQLGLIPTGPKSVRLDEQAPLAALRRRMF